MKDNNDYLSNGHVECFKVKPILDMGRVGEQPVREVLSVFRVSENPPLSSVDFKIVLFSLNQKSRYQEPSLQDPVSFRSR